MTFYLKRSWHKLPLRLMILKNFKHLKIALLGILKESYPESLSLIRFMVVEIFEFENFKPNSHPHACTPTCARGKNQFIEVASLLNKYI